jgi:hypothetical protein
MAEGFTRGDVGDVYFDNGGGNRGNAIAQSDTRVGIPTGIEDDSIGVDVLQYIY